MKLCNLVKHLKWIVAVSFVGAFTTSVAGTNEWCEAARTAGAAQVMVGGNSGCSTYGRAGCAQKNDDWTCEHVVNPSTQVSKLCCVPAG